MNGLLNLCKSYPQIILTFHYGSAPVPQGENGCDTRLFDLAKSVHWIVESEEGGSTKRRKLGDDSDDDENIAPPINDIYRLRQQKRVK